MYKYVLKGHEQIEMGVKERINEIEDYSNSLYVSSREATYRILGFSMHGESHYIIRLEVHLGNAKRIIFNPSQSRTEIQSQMLKKSKFEAFLSITLQIPML